MESFSLSCLCLFSSFPRHLCCWLWPKYNHLLLYTSLPRPLNDVLPVLKTKEKDLSKHEIPEQSCLFLGDLFTFPEGFGDTHKKEQVIIISILLATIFSYFNFHVGYSNIRIFLLNSDDLCLYLYFLLALP